MISDGESDFYEYMNAPRSSNVDVLRKQNEKKQLTLKQALITIAALAGFTPSKNQPLPGEKAIWKGWTIFNNICDGYNLALQKSYET